MNPFVKNPQPQGEQPARAVLVGLRISSWSAKKYDKQVSEAAAAAHGADNSAGRFNKNLIPSTTKVAKQVETVIKKGKNKGQTKTETVIIETNSHKELMAHIAETRQWYYENTLQWTPGWRCLPIANWQQFTDGLRERKHKYDALLPVFVGDYPGLVDKAKRLLNDGPGGMFKPADYPANIEAEFEWETLFDKMPGRESGDIRIALADADIAMIEASINARADEAWAKAQGDAVRRLYEVLANIHKRLSTTKVSKRKADAGEQIAGGFKDTLVQNCRDVCDVLTRLNVANDPQLEAFRRETELLATVEPDTLRDNGDVAKETAARADDILKRMTGAYGANLFAGL